MAGGDRREDGPQVSLAAAGAARVVPGAAGGSGATVSFSTNGSGPRDADRTSTGLIIGGAVTMALGLGASSMIASTSRVER